MRRKSCGCGFGSNEIMRRMHEEHAAKLKVGDRVRYSAMFLRSTGQYTGEVPFAKGRIVGFDDLGPGTKLAEIEWENCDCPRRVNAFNLWKVSRLEPD